MLSLQHVWVVFYPLNGNVESRYLGDHESRVLEKLVTFRGLWNDPVQAHYTSLRSSWAEGVHKVTKRYIC